MIGIEEMIEFINKPETCDALNISPATLDRQEKAGLIPPSISVSNQRKVKIKSEIEAIQHARIAGLDNDEIKNLVLDLISKRAESRKIIAK